MNEQRELVQVKNLSQTDHFLLPCPFCGGKATLEEAFGGYFVVGCLNGNCEMQPNTHAYYDDCGTRATEVWNSRSEF